MKFKKILSFLGLILLIAGGMFFIISKEKSGAEIKKVSSQPSIPNLSNKQIETSINIKKESFVFPEEMPVYNASFAFISTENAKTIATRLGFIGEEKVFQDIKEGQKLIWSTDEKSLIITQNKGNISYTLQRLSSQSGNFIDESTLIDNAKKYLIEKLGIEETKFVYDSIEYLQENKNSESFIKASKNSAQVAQINFNYNLSSHTKILTANPNIPAILIRVLPNGEIFMAKVYIFTSFTESKNKFQILNYNDLLKSGGKIKIIDIDNTYGSTLDIINKQAKKYNINKAEIVYLIDKDFDTQLQPVFLLSGEIITTTNEVPYTGKFYLPAIKE